MFPGEKQLGLELAQVGVEPPGVDGQLVQDRRVFLGIGQLQELADVSQAPLEVVLKADLVLQGAQLPEDGLAVRRGLPEIGLVYLGLQVGQSRALGFEVKETPSAPRVGRSWFQAGGGFHRPVPCSLPVKMLSRSGSRGL